MFANLQLFRKSTLSDSVYQSFLAEEKIRISRVLLSLGFFLYGAFLVVDFWALSSSFDAAIIVRSISISIIFASLLFTFHKSFLKFYSPVLILAIGSTLAGIEVLMYLAKESESAYESYFAGLMIVMIALYSWTYLHPLITASLSILSVISYLYIEYYIRDVGSTDRVATLITNSFFLGSAIIFGFFAQLQRDRYLKQNFLLQKSLAEALEQKTEEAKSQAYLANHDPLTDLPNRRYMMEQLEESLQYAKDNNRVLVVMYMDLNGFKQVNDIYGHSAGDEVLVIVAKRLELAIRKGDLISRLGGDEYLMGLMIHEENLDEVEGMIEKFVMLIEQPMNIDGLRLQIGASIGIAAYPMHGDQIEVLVDIADKKMYGAKKDGKTMPVNLSESKSKEQKPVIAISSTTGSTTL